MTAKKEAKKDVSIDVSHVNLKMDKDEFSKYERARMIGSRALQIAQGAQPLIKLTKKHLEEIKYNPIEIAKMEFEKGVVPISVKRELPHERREEAPKK